MEEKYDFKKVESKWQEIWAKNPNSGAKDFDTRKKHYQLVEFPYPSGAGLHVGHCMGYTASDAFSRMKRMQGENVLFPIGWDAFGLPTENYAIKTGIKPAEATKQNIATFKKQMKRMAYSFDWDREINTTDPDYYRFTQWIFLQFYKHAVVDGKLIEVADDDATTPRLAYQAEMAINWCPSCKIGLANEEVIGGKCERCDSVVSKKMQKQWMLRITAYADRLIKDLDTVEYLEKIKTQQINWIGRSEGTNVRFEIKNKKSKIKNKESLRDDYHIDVFTTRADTLFGCTYVVLAPEHPLLENLKSQISNLKAVEEYILNSKKKSDMERTELAKEKTGVKLDGVKAVNPINNKEIDIYIADYVLANYGTGAVMAVPAHDERDFEFAKKYGIKIIPVILKSNINYRSYLMGAENITDEDLEKLDIIIIEKDNKHRKIEIPVKSIMLYEDLIKDRLNSGFWNEYIGKDIVFIFKHQNGEIERLPYINKNVERINKLTAEFTNDTSEKTIIEDWLENGADGFYKDYLLSTDYGVLIDSGNFSGLVSEEAKRKITEKLKSQNMGDFAVNYKLRDWVFSRQHYWGEPIPIVYCANCAKTIGKSQISNLKSQNYGIITTINNKEHMMVPVPEDELPVLLPEVENYQPTDTGESPLANIHDWVNVKCPKCGGEARRETDTMPNWAGSSWYFIAYAISEKLKDKSEKIDDAFNASKDELKYWLPVDLYNGGMEHTTLHLLYSRFWHKFLYDLKLVPGSEPYQKRIAHGIILGADGRKMSKSFGNVVNPDEIVDKFGADTLRAYIMFIGPYDSESAWSMAGVQGIYRFINKLWENYKKSKEIQISEVINSEIQKLIHEVETDIGSFSFNTYIAKLMTFNNILSKETEISLPALKTFAQLLSPAMPHLAEELWSLLGEKESIFKSVWPKFDQSKIKTETINIPIQVAGKLRDLVTVEPGTSKDELEKLALSSPKVQSFIAGKKIKKIIVIPDKIISIVL